MHVTPISRENLYGVRTTYGTHPRQPRRLVARLRGAAHRMADGTTAAAVAALAAWYFVRSRRS